jgi:glycerol-3-phosphate dehydrogenase subunit C
VNGSAEQIALEVVDLCSNCDQCRDLMADTPCLFFPKLYRLHDARQSGKRTITAADLQALVGLCNMCGQCSCPPVRVKIREAKAGFAARHGFRLRQRFLMDVRLVGRIGNAFPRLANVLLHREPLAGWFKQLIGMHPERKVPRFPERNLTHWVRKRRLHVMRPASGRKVAYFIGCSAKYLFPQVVKATVEVLERNGVTVFIPEQRCCGTPAMLEGDRRTAFKSATFNLRELARCIDAGYDIVTSCPTCGYMFKSLLRDGANYSEEYRRSLQRMLDEEGGDLKQLCDRVLREEAVQGRERLEAGRKTAMALKLTLAGLCRDEGYFASLGAHDRMKVARHTYDLGEYLRLLAASGELDRNFGSLPGGMVYYPPCHLKEVGIGQPWQDVLAEVPGFSMATVGGPFDCCGSAGIRGFQTGFHKASLAQGKPLMEKIRASRPERIVTDCLSCRLQFNQMLPFPVSHPVEMLKEAYRSGDRAAVAGDDGQERL